MLNRPIGLGGIALLLLLGPSPGPATAAPQKAQSAPAAAAQPSALCADCHDQAKAFAGNAHALAKQKAGATPNTVCESCHGDGTKHMDAGGEKNLITVPAGLAGAETCLKCHDKSVETLSMRHGPHAPSETVNCLTCHAIHKAAPKAGHLLAKPQREICSNCHPGQDRSFKDKPFAHRLGRGGLECASCHEPHGRLGPGMLKTSRTGDLPCLSCHSEKKGPFVFEHVTGTVGDCLKCHEPHGSTNPRMLIRSRVDQLCLECHSDLSKSTLGSQPVATHNLLTARYRNCTTCHTAIHGSNRSPKLLK